MEILQTFTISSSILLTVFSSLTVFYAVLWGVKKSIEMARY